MLTLQEIVAYLIRSEYPKQVGRGGDTPRVVDLSKSQVSLPDTMRIDRLRALS